MVNFIKGIFIGAAAILPGISSGVICIVTGLYEKLLDTILNFFKDIQNNIKFLFPISLGSIVGIVLFSKIILYCLKIIPVQTNSLFIGLLLGSTFLLYKKLKITKLNKVLKLSDIIPFIICFSIGIFLIIIEKRINIQAHYLQKEFSTFFLILSRFLHEHRYYSSWS